MKNYKIMEKPLETKLPSNRKSTLMWNILISSVPNSKKSINRLTSLIYKVLL